MSKEKQARANLEKKIDRHREQRAKDPSENESIVSLAEEKRKNLLRMLDEFENDDVEKETRSVMSLDESVRSNRVQLPNNQINLNQQQKFEELEYLQQAKSKINELTRIV